MFEFDLQQSFTSNETLICFFSKPTDHEFRQALSLVMEPHGFICNFGCYHISIKKLTGDKKLRQLVIHSDPWFVWGESLTWGKDLALNQELINWLQKELLKSGLFELRNKTY
ncbi:MAG: hypothetical protein RLZZ29_690 [Cyanobacteriota bacterium]|jgi:hypothetical protein